MSCTEFPNVITARELMEMDFGGEPEDPPLEEQPGFNRRAFRQWLMGQPRDAWAGDPTCVYQCVPARFLRSQGAADPAVWDIGFSPNMRQEGFLKLPEWVRRFSRAEEAGGRRWISFGECLAILDSLNGATAEPANVPESRGFVYLIRAETGVFKIGKATNVARRMANLGHLSPVALELVHTISAFNALAAESDLHRRFRARRVRGEWFALTPEDVEYVCSLRAWTREGWL